MSTRGKNTTVSKCAFECHTPKVFQVIKTNQITLSSYSEREQFNLNSTNRVFNNRQVFLRRAGVGSSRSYQLHSILLNNTQCKNVTLMQLVCQLKLVSESQGRTSRMTIGNPAQVRTARKKKSRLSLKYYGQGNNLPQEETREV